MKSASSALLARLAAARSVGGSSLCMADCYKITLAAGSIAQIADGTVLAYTSLDVPVLLGGVTYLANSVQVDGMRYKSSTGLSVDTQQITMSAWPGVAAGGVPFLQAVQQGLLDGAEIQRDRAFFAGFDGAPPLTPLGSILLFKGRVTEIGSVGRTSATVSVASDLTLLALDMPHRLFQVGCLHVLYDGSCRAARAAYTFTGTVAAGSGSTAILWAGANPNFQQGSLTFTSGPNTGVSVTINGAGTGFLSLAYPLPNLPTTGDAFAASYGCDHTMTTCAGRFGNMANFLGFPFLPPPQIITGPLATTGPSGGKG